ncbi:MAG TPA: CHAT domain-containing tetratricopeptide repeat protein [Nonomuraea sp.]|nr:CHAT domain-containing tetratricopeptide repeat protein [Nonomuraea sp.]
MMGPVMMGAVSRRLRALTQDAMRSGNYRTALVHARLAVGTAERSDDPRELDAALFLLACVYSMFQRGAKEAECAERRIALAERLGDELMLASALAQRAEARILGGRPAEGAEDARRALVLLGDREPPAPPSRWAMLTTLGEAALQAGMLDEAFDALDEAYLRSVEAGEHKLAALAASQLSRVSLNLSQPERAVEWGRTAEDHLGRVPGGPSDDTAEVFGNLGLTLSMTGRHDEAAAAIGTALRMARGIPVLRRQGLILAAEIARAAARYPEAADHLDRWFAEAEPMDRRGRAQALNLLALVRMAEDDFDQASAHLTESLALKREVDDTRGVAVALSNLIRLNLDAGRPDEARDLAPECEALWSGFADRAPDEPGLAGLHGKIVAPLSQALQELHLAADEPFEALRLAERGRSGPLTAQLRGAREGRETVPAEPPDLDRISGLARRLDASLLFYQAHFDFMRVPVGVDPLATLRHLRAIHAWMVSPGGERSHQRIPGADVVAALESGPMVTHSRDIPDLGPLLLRPFRDELAPGRPVIVLPDWILWGMPFAAFSLDEGVQLIERHPVTFAQSLHGLELLAADPLPGPAGAPLIISAPEGARLPLSTGGHADAAPLDVRETARVTDLYEVEPLSGEACTVGAVLERLRGADLVHVFAHAYLDAHLRLDRPPGTIALSPAAGDDGQLTSDMIADESLRARLVVLTCCHSGSGMITPEGVRGLVRAFFVSGAERVVAMLRNVPPVPSARIAALFHEELRRSESVADALRAALLRGRSDYPDPAIWGSFILHGPP